MKEPVAAACSLITRHLPQTPPAVPEAAKPHLISDDVLAASAILE